MVRAERAEVSLLRYLVCIPFGQTFSDIDIPECLDSLFQALRWWGRRESERHVKSWRGWKKEGRRPSSPQFPPVLFSCSCFMNSADPTISEPGLGYVIGRTKAFKTIDRCCTRDRAEGGAGGALAPPLFCKNKNKLNRK